MHDLGDYKLIFTTLKNKFLYLKNPDRIVMHTVTTLF